MATLRLEKINKIFPNGEHVLKDISIEVNDKELVTILGPTGCGKTTLLRIIAGVEQPTSGKIFVDNEEITDLPPQKRNVAMIFQDFALYPHMTVYDNIVFGLKSRGFTKQKIYRVVKNTLDILLIHNLLERYPSELSFGQKQRVAVARAITREPKIFLFDEPLSNLDARLREHLRVELKKIHQKLGVTTLYVTHDQTEAMSISDRIIVMRDGMISQVGTPYELYFFPQDTFVAKFIGSPEINLIVARIIGRENNLYVDLKDSEILLPQKWYQKVEKYKDNEIVVGIRPEDLYDRLWYEGKILGNTIRGKVDTVEMLGDKKIVFIEWYGYTLRMVVPAYDEISTNEIVDVVIDTNKILLFDPNTQKRIV